VAVEVVAVTGAFTFSSLIQALPR